MFKEYPCLFHSPFCILQLLWFQISQNNETPNRCLFYQPQACKAVASCKIQPIYWTSANPNSRMQLVAAASRGIGIVCNATVLFRCWKSAIKTAQDGGLISVEFMRLAYRLPLGVSVYFAECETATTISATTIYLCDRLRSSAANCTADREHMHAAGDHQWMFSRTFSRSPLHAAAAANGYLLPIDCRGCPCTPPADILLSIRYQLLQFDHLQRLHRTSNRLHCCQIFTFGTSDRHFVLFTSLQILA